MIIQGNSLAVQCLGLCAFTAEGIGFISGQGTKISHVAWSECVCVYVCVCVCVCVCKDFLGGSVGKESACNTGNPSSIPGLRRSPREGNGNSLQYSCLENSMD